ncbi:MAG: copper resistance CopC family protein [Pseudonocardiaceae bacterium]
MTCDRGQRWVRAGFVAVAAAVLALGAVPAADADVSVVRHNELLGTDPLDGGQLTTGPARVILTFDLPAKRGFSTVIVTGPDGDQWQAGPATEDEATVSAPVRPLGPAGDYTVAWRIVSADGHPTRGTFRFTLTTPGTGAAATPPPAVDRSATRSAGTALWPWLAGAGALLVAGVLLALRITKGNQGKRSNSTGIS